MRFATKFDRRIAAGVILIAMLTLGLAARGWLILDRTGPAPLLGVSALWLYAVLSMLPQYYELREDGLFLRLGVARKALIPYASLVNVQPEKSTRAAGVFSVDRIRIATSEPRTFLRAKRPRAIQRENRRSRYAREAAGTMA